MVQGQTPEAKYGFFLRLWYRICARYRWSMWAVCEMSKDRGLNDYHDYDDCRCKTPWHDEIHHCERCGKAFTI